jgi:hypothetical protein
MEMKTPKLASAALFTGVAMTLAACGAGSSSHVVAQIPTTTAATASTTTTVVPGTVAGSNPVSTPVAGTPTTTPSTALNPQTLDQVAADLGALDNSLNTASSDLSHPQGDS